MAAADLITLDDEENAFTKPLTIFDPKDTWKRMTLADYSTRKMLEPLIKHGAPAGELPSLREIQAFRQEEEKSIWEQHLRLVNPSAFKVDLSDKLWELRSSLLHENRRDA